MINRFIPKYIFIYLTEKCNLKCGYCYFKDKKGRTLDLCRIERFLDWVNGPLCARPAHFILSGGEPCLFWPLVKKTVARIRKRFPGASIGLQTNATLLDGRKIDFVTKNGLHLEIGIDGDFQTTSAHRIGIDRKTFDALTRRIRAALSKGADVSCTMTVHPRQAAKLYHNFLFLKKLGLKKIDVTPAAFAQWSGRKSRVFKKEYLKIVESGDYLKKVYTQEDRLCAGPALMDLSLHPPGYVFCGDVFLCLPERLRKKYSLADLEKDRPLNEKNLDFFLNKYKKYSKEVLGRPTYRDFVSCGFKIVNDMAGRPYLNARTMVDFHDFFKKVYLVCARGS